MRATILVVLALALASQGDPLREAMALGRTHDDVLFASFNTGYDLSPSGVVTHAEIVTEFRRTVLIAREHALQGDFAFTLTDLGKAIVPLKDLVAFIVEVRLHPLNTFVKEPAYDLYVSTGPRSPPIGAKTLKRDPVFAPGGGPGSMVVAVRIEAAFPRAEIDRAAMPELIVTDDRAEVLWQARVDLSRYR